MSVFHHWLLADPAGITPACAIVIHGEDNHETARLIPDIARYLNEYDDDGDGRWLPVSDELVEQIARDANHRRLLGLAEASADPARTFRDILAALGRRGHVVLGCHGPGSDKPDPANTFHAGVGHRIRNRCHVIVDPALVDSRCVAHIIGDVFLEWLHCETRRDASISDIR
jgi:hypothetical protein